VYNGGGDAIARIDIGAFEVQAAGVVADFDGDLGSDFLAWQRGLGSSGPIVTKNLGNADGDDDVDGADLAAWKAAFGVTEAADVAFSSSQPLATAHESGRRVPALGSSLRPALKPEIVDAAMVLEHSLPDLILRRHMRVRMRRR
jgi:hypothetical protein